MIFDFRLQVFDVVARRLSFTKAAAELFITQPAVTKHIRALEQQLNAKLFDRRGNSILLTESGKVLWRYTRQLGHVYNDLEQEMSSFSDRRKGTLTIGASTTIAQYVLSPLLAAFRKENPGILLNVRSGNTEKVEEALVAGEIDLGFIEGHTRNKQIKYLSFRKDEIVLVAKATHRLAARKKLLPRDLEEVSFVMREPGSGTLEVIQRALKKLGLKWPQLNIDLQLDSTEGIKTYLLYSECLAFMSACAVRGAQSDALFKIIPVQGLRIERPLNAIHLQGQPSRLAGTFLRFTGHYNQK